MEEMGFLQKKRRYSKKTPSHHASREHNPQPHEAPKTPSHTPHSSRKAHGPVPPPIFIIVTTSLETSWFYGFPAKRGTAGPVHTDRSCLGKNDHGAGTDGRRWLPDKQGGVECGWGGVGDSIWRRLGD